MGRYSFLQNQFELKPKTTWTNPIVKCILNRRVICMLNHIVGHMSNHTVEYVLNYTLKCT